MKTRIFYNKQTAEPIQVVARAKTKPNFQDVVCFQELTNPYDFFVMDIREFFKEYTKDFPELVKKPQLQIEKKQDLPDKQPRIAKGVVMEEEISTSSSDNAAGENIDISSMTPTEKMMAFFDADSYKDKIKILEDMKEDLDEHILNNLAVSLDITIDDGQDGYYEILSELRIRERYEGRR